MNPATLHVVGLGPGDAQCLTPQARQVLHEARCVAGYHLYMDLVPPELLEGKTRISTGMRQEAERCAAAVDAALAGEPTALVCSGDPGIYALAGLALETLEARGLVGVVPFAVVPGVPAVCAAAALLGAPLMHDFACISLSDLLTPWETIVRRLEAALAADFVCVLYNPRSRGRQGQLAAALDDGLMGVTQVVRGRDILPSTPRQIVLLRLLRLPVPAYAHVPLLLDAAGERLAKRHHSLALRTLRERGVDARLVVGLLGRLAGCNPSGAALRPQDLLADFSLAKLPRADIHLEAGLVDGLLAG